MKRFARYAMALAMVAATTTTAMAQSLSDSSPKTGGYGAQNLYLQNVVPVTLTINPACTSLDTTNAISFGSTQPTTATPLQAPFGVLWNCSQGVNPRLYFQSSNGLANGNSNCLLTNGANQIVYTVVDQADGASGANYCQGSGFNPSLLDPHVGAGSGAEFFNAQIPQLISNSGFSYPATGNYTDNLNVYLEF